ncbi:MAG: HRDC domain-containing protein, partial [Pseudohongiellaceae bacterium]
RGGSTDKIFQFNHQHLPVYGVGDALDNNQWRSVFRQLVARGYLSVDLERFGALRLGEKCRPLLRGEETIQLRRDTVRKSPKTKPTKRAKLISADADINEALWEALRALRKSLADERGVPPYVIFHDSTLQEMCLARPQDLEQFAQLSGVGQSKLEKYGNVFLRVIAEH